MTKISLSTSNGGMRAEQQQARFRYVVIQILQINKAFSGLMVERTSWNQNYSSSKEFYGTG